MRRRSRLSVIGLILGLLTIVWTLSFENGVSAQKEHHHRHAPESARQLKNPLASTEENFTGGRILYNQHCASCHGEDGKALTEAASTMKARPADLTTAHNITDGEIYWVATNGIKESGMPSFQSKLSERERWRVALYVKYLGKTKGEHQHATTAKSDTAQPDRHKDHDMRSGGAQPSRESQHSDHSMRGMMTTVTGGPFRSMRALGSGTALQPASTPVYAWMFMPGEWMAMLHGELKVGFNHQGGPRGVGKAESQNWLMAMAEHNLGQGRMMLRGMFSAEPLTAPHGGFPQLFQTGELYRRRPIIDAQHPHDLFMELAASYTIPISESASFQIYGGPVGEPALGPVAFPHRLSAMENPSAPLGHHLQDSTHITAGVVTGALTAWRFKFESSLFQGAEPDENRATIDLGKLDSHSFRIWFTPTRNWAGQFSYGRLRDPEEVEPGVLKRMTASISYNRPMGNGNWASTLIWGRNDEEHGGIENSYLFESTINFLSKNYIYTRIELLDKKGLLGDNIFGRQGLVPVPVIPEDIRDRPGDFHLSEELERQFRIAAFTIGGVRDFVNNEKARMGVGAGVTFYHKPSELDPIYGQRPISFQVFLRFRPGEMR
jgi:mono/diheme cytochrome c family protein